MSRRSETVIEEICPGCPKGQMEEIVATIDLDKDNHPWVPGALFISAIDRLEIKLVKAGWDLIDNKWYCSKCANRIQAT